MRVLLSGLWVAWTLLIARVVFESWRDAWTPFFVLALIAALIVDAALAAAALAVRSRAELVRNGLLLAASSLSTLLLADLALNRLLDVHRYATIDPDPSRHHRLRPSSRSLMRSNEFRVELVTNRLGLRGPEIAPRETVAYRVIVLGDSFTMGEGVPREATFEALLEARLAEALGARVEVVNAGVDSYTPLLSYLFLRDDLLSLAPDTVVLAVDMSDLLQEQYYRSLAAFGPGGEPMAVPNRRAHARLAVSVEDWISSHLYVLRLAFLTVRDAVNGGAPETMEAIIARRTGGLLRHTLEEDDEDRIRQWADLLDSVDRTRRLCDRENIRFILAVYPWGHQVNAREWVPGRFSWMAETARPSDASIATIRRWAHEQDVTLVDAFPRFRAYSGERLLYFRWDMHFTPAGHQLMADVLFDPLMDAAPDSVRRHAGVTR